MLRTRTMSSTFSLPLLLLALLILYSSPVSASIPQVFQHTNLLRTIDLTKPYIRDSTALIVENVSNTTQTEYFWPIPSEIGSKMSSLEVREKKTGASPNFAVEKAVEENAYNDSCKGGLMCRMFDVYKIEIPSLAPGERIPLVISSAYVDCLTPYPTIVAQDAKQYLLYSGEKYTPTLYTTLKQKTKIKSLLCRRLSC